MIQEALSIVNQRDNVTRYQERMDSVSDAKFQILQPLIENLRERAHPVVVSFGSGSGKVERMLALSGLDVLAIDLSLRMLQTIQGQAEIVEDVRAANSLPEHPVGHLWVVNADASHMPFQSADAIVAMSVVHEIASFGHQYQFEALRDWFGEVATRLKPGGYLVIKDFAEPTRPNKLVTVKLGVSQNPEEMSPLAFAQKFGQEFKGTHTDLLNAQIVLHQAGQTWQPGATLILPKYLASELIAHYSWHSSPEEIHERYAYLTQADYAQFVIEAAATEGVELKLISSEASVQPGYDDFTKGRIDLFGSDGQREVAPVISASWVWQRTTS